MHLRHLHYLTLLARERHFGHAAEAANITQSTLSAAIRQLEAELGVPLVERDQRFRGFTPQGDILLAWARRLLDARAALAQELSRLEEGLTGALRLAAIPAALPVIGLLTTPFNRLHPRVTFTVVSRTSVEIQRGLDEFQYDAGITYLDNEPLVRVRSLPLYKEHYILLTPADGPFAGRRGVSWQEAAALRLCLLTPDMQNRRILNGVFREVGLAPRTTVETNSVMVLCSQVRAGAWSSILPHSFLWLSGTPPGTMALPLGEPRREHQVGLVVRDHAPAAPIVAALEAITQSLDLQPAIDAIAGI